MRTDAPLNFRYQDILTAIVRAYIDTGEPVGSRTISKRRHNTLSPASIRNVMADLADEVALRVGDDMPLAALDLLAGVEPARPAAFRGLHRLAVDDARGRARVS